MCKYCEKGKRINDENTTVYIHWKDCVPMLRVVKPNEFCTVSIISLKIIYCPWCGRDLIND